MATAATDMPCKQKPECSHSGFLRSGADDQNHLRIARKELSQRSANGQRLFQWRQMRRLLQHL